jgi:uncharacterized membrane protein YhhN
VHVYYFLVVPVVFGVIAATQGYLPLKLGVPGVCALILIAFFRGTLRTRRDVWYVVAAFVFSMVGDAFLSNKGDDEMMFVYGIAGFFLAHLGYFGYALANGRVHRPALLVLAAGFVPFFIWSLNPAIDDAILSGAVLVYLLVSITVLAAALGLRLAGIPKWSYIAGIASIVVSDTFIAFNEFLDITTFNDWILPTYYFAHIIITFGILNRNLREQEGRTAPLRTASST